MNRFLVFTLSSILILGITGISQNVFALDPGDILVPDPNGLGGAKPALFKVDPTTGARTVFSDFTDALQGPTSIDANGITIDSNGDVWVVASNFNQAVQRGALFKLDPTTGDRTLISDFADSSQGPLGIQPFRVAADDSGNIFVTDTGPDSSSTDTFLFKINSVTGARTILSNFADITQGPTGRLPFNIAIDSSGDLLVSDLFAGVAGNGLIFKIDPITGDRTVFTDFQTPPGFPTGRLPHGLAIDSSGNIIATTITGGTNGRGLLISVDPITGDRTELNDFGNLAQGPEAFSSERAVAIDADGDYLVVDEKAGPAGLGLLFKIDHITGTRIALSDFGNPSQGVTGRDPFDVAIVPSPSIILIESNIEPSTFRCGSNGVVPLTIFGTATFDPFEIDINSITMNGNPVSEKHGKFHTADKNNDGIDDLVFHVDDFDGVLDIPQEDCMQIGQVFVLLSASLDDGTLIESGDYITLR